MPGTFLEQSFWVVATISVVSVRFDHHRPTEKDAPSKRFDYFFCLAGTLPLKLALTVSNSGISIYKPASSKRPSKSPRWWSLSPLRPLQRSLGRTWQYIHIAKLFHSHLLAGKRSIFTHHSFGESNDHQEPRSFSSGVEKKVPRVPRHLARKNCVFPRGKRSWHKGKLWSISMKSCCYGPLFFGDMFIFGGVGTLIETWSVYLTLPTPMVVSLALISFAFSMLVALLRANMEISLCKCSQVEMVSNPVGGRNVHNL